MKILSLLSNSKRIIIFFLSVLTFSMILVLTIVKDKSSQTEYHQSIWNEYEPEIEKAIKVGQPAKVINLKHVYGGVVSHHIPATIPKLVEFYDNLRQTQSVKNFIVIGPDHTDSGKASITVSNANFFTVYSQVKSIDGLALKLGDNNLANIEEPPFELEHSIGSQILIISKIFPGAKVTPIIVRSDTTKDQAEKLGKMLSELINDETVVIASVDFSHYFSTEQAFSLDRISGEIVRNLDMESFSLIKADSNKSLIIFMEAMKRKGSLYTDQVETMNTNDLMQNSDYTTGYIFGYWGTR